MTILDWTGPDHWSWKPSPCRLCGAPTHLLDDAGRPAHKQCVEATFTQRALRWQAANGRPSPAGEPLTPPTGPWADEWGGRLCDCGQPIHSLRAAAGKTDCRDCEQKENQP